MPGRVRVREDVSVKYSNLWSPESGPAKRYLPKDMKSNANPSRLNELDLLCSQKPLIILVKVFGIYQGDHDETYSMMRLLL